MANLSYLGQEPTLSSAALTVRVQAVSPLDNGRGGQLLYDAFFPRRDVDSVKLSEITTLDFRPVADRREWNARGRAVQLVTPPLRDIEMVPVESYFKIDEYEIQRLTERTFGNQALFRQQIGATIPERTVNLAIANNRRLEVDAFTAWALGQVTARNPQTGATQTVSFGFSSSRYTTAGTAWNVATNAYTAFTTWLQSARDLVGSFQGVMLRQATLNEIILDAPNQNSYNSAVPTTMRGVEQRIQDEFGTAFQFYVNENSEDVYTGAGLTVARTKIWPTGYVALVPAGERVGTTAFAPVARAYEQAQGAPNAGINVRGMTAYSDISNGGRELTVECQVNALPIPNEQQLAVINAGV